MAYVAPIHRPSSARHALRTQLFPNEPACLVLAKLNRLEVWKVDRADQVLKLGITRHINGTITILQRIRPLDADRDTLYIGTDKFHYITLAWGKNEDGSGEDLQTVTSTYDTNEKFLRDGQSQDKCVVDPSGRFVVTLLWEGVLNILRLPTKKKARDKIEWMDQIRIAELYIKAATFLHTETNQPKVAFLYQSRTDMPDARLVTYRLFADDKCTQISRFEYRDQVDRIDIADPGAAMLIPVGYGDDDQKRFLFRKSAQVKAQLGGLIVVGETRLLYYDDAAKKKVETPLLEASVFVCWAEYDVSHYFVADDYGAMWVLEIKLEGSVVTDMCMKKLGVTSRATSLVYMGSNLLFVGSHHGDSQLWRINTNTDLWSMQLVEDQAQDLQNISPILDFNVMDLGNREGDGERDDLTINEYSSGQARIVTGSGVYKDGTLRSVRSGVGLEDVGIIEAAMDNTRALFALRSVESAHHDALVVSFPTETRVFKFDMPGGVEEVEVYNGLLLGCETLLAQSLANKGLLQVTPTSVYLSHADRGMVAWSPEVDQIITSASANDDWLLLAVDGRSLISFRLGDGLTQVGSDHVGATDQIACIHLPPQFREIGVVGFWESGTVSIIDLQTLLPLHAESVRRKDDGASIPRDIVLAQILPPERHGPTLFVSMEDGFIISFNVAKTNYALSGRRSVLLGNRHARLQLLPRPNGVYNVFATSEHPSLIYGSHGRVIYSAITAEEAVCVCHFHAEAFAASIVVATESGVKICQIDNQQRTHVKTLSMGETVRRLAYSRAERAFALGCVNRVVKDNQEIIHSSIKLVDEVGLDRFGSEFRLLTSPGIELVESVIRAQVQDSYGSLVDRFVVGTSIVQTLAASRVKGRILVMGIDSDRNPYQLLSRNLKGACRCLAVMGDFLVAALSKTVVVYRYTEITTTSGKLDLIASYRPATYPTDISVHGNMIGVADLMKSMTLVEFTPATKGVKAKLEEVARHHQVAWSTAVAHIEDSSWLQCDAQGNLMVLQRNKDGVTSEERRRMEITSELNLGEMVNKVHKISVEASENAIIIPRAFLGTVEGGIYLFGTVAPAYQDLLIRFQTNLARYEAAGYLEHDKYRAFRNEEREGEKPFRFIDGELIETFLDQDDDTQDKICEGLGRDVEAMRNLVEELKRLH